MKKKEDKDSLEKAETIIYILNAFLRLIGALAEPFMPSFSAKLYEIMNIKYEGESLKILGLLNAFIETNPNDSMLFLVKMKLIEEGHMINKPKPLFKEITYEETISFKERFKGKEV